MFELILGGFKSGKSRFALELLNKGEKKGLVVTAKGLDFDFKQQILEHRKERDKEILVFESGYDLGKCLEDLPTNLDSLLIEGLDFWFFSIITLRDREQILNNFWNSLKKRRENVFLISSEMSLGFLPSKIDLKMARRFGAFNQKLAQLCSKVYLVIAGCPIVIKESSVTS